MVKQLETMIFDAMTKGGALSSEDIQMILALGEAMENAEDLIPPEAVRLFKTAMKQRRGSVDNVAETLMSSLTASGESKENVAKAMIKALKATGASPEEIAKTMYQAMEKAGASPEEMARVMAQALADSGASRKCSTIVQNFLAFSRNFLKNDFSLFFFFFTFFLADEINKVLKATFAKAMANNPNAAADMARCMAEAMAASGASAEEIAATMQEALNSSLCNIDLDHLDELLDVADTVARSMADAGASPQEIAAAMKAAFKVL